MAHLYQEWFDKYPDEGPEYIDGFPVIMTGY